MTSTKKPALFPKEEGQFIRFHSVLPAHSQTSAALYHIQLHFGTSYYLKMFPKPENTGLTPAQRGTFTHSWSANGYLGAMTVEVCIDNLESLATAISAGAGRIELCSALALGGLTPSRGFMLAALAQSTVPVYPIIRHRPGDFVFDRQELALMTSDIATARQAGAQGVVVGALTQEGDIDQNALHHFIEAAQGIDITFHRAFDLCRDPLRALEILTAAGCQRILTSGQQASAVEGIPLIRTLVSQAGDRISLMPGGGVNARNALHIKNSTGVHEIHLSGKTTRPGRMQHQSPVNIDGHSEAQGEVTVTDFQRIQAVVDRWASQA